MAQPLSPTSPNMYPAFDNIDPHLSHDPNAADPHFERRQRLSGGFAVPHHLDQNMASNGDGAVQMPRGPTSNLPSHPLPPPTSRHRSALSMNSFEGPGSPPNPKSTAHVPCKFFRFGQCQAGKACPFSHALENTGEEVCRYFQKGNCKFGHKCALAHVLPSGRRVNRPMFPLNHKGLMDPGAGSEFPMYPPQDPALTHSLLAQQANGGPLPFAHQLPPFHEADRALQIPRNHPPNGIPSIDTEYASPQFGSPTDPYRPSFTNGPHLNVMDAPLPASFDSQGISYIARHGPVAASLPSKFGAEFSSPPSASYKAAAPLEQPNNALRSTLAAQRNPRNKTSDLGSSPLTSGDEGQAFRFLHSQRIKKSNNLSASVPRGGTHAGDWEDSLYFSEGEETDFIPPSLHDQILTPQERLRRSSRNDQDNRSVREALSGIGTPGESSSKVGSPHTGSPSSRYGAFFARRQQHEAGNTLGSSPSAFGPVGSPLRSLHPGASPSLRAKKDPTDASSSTSFPAFASPPRHSSMSILSQQLSRSQISAKASAEGGTGEKPLNLHPNSARHVSGPNAGFSRSVSTSTANKDRIEEEQGGEGIFALEEDEEVRSKRSSGGSNPHNAWGAIGSKRGGEWN